MAARRPRATSGRPRGADSVQRRAEILDAAEELFADQGYRGVSMSAVARAAGISQTGLVHYFATKDDLLAAVLDRRDEQDTAQLLTTPEQGWRFVETLVGVVRQNEERETLVRLYTALSGEAVTPDHPATRWLRRHHHDVRENITAAVEQAVADGELVAEAPADHISRLLVAAMDGLQVQWLVDESSPSMAEDFRQLVDALHAQWRAD